MTTTRPLPTAINHSAEAFLIRTLGLPSTCEATFSGLARVISADADRPCATQRSGVGMRSCDEGSR